MASGARSADRKARDEALGLGSLLVGSPRLRQAHVPSVLPLHPVPRCQRDRGSRPGLPGRLPRAPGRGPHQRPDQAKWSVVVMSTKIRYERVLVTPAKAVKWLGLNSPVNRSKKASKIGGYAADMQAGRWNSNTGETIKFDTSGTLIDGQNRLEAVVLANVPVEFDVAYDVPSEAMIVIDSGAART